MSIKPILLKALTSEDLSKLNLMSFHLKTPVEYSKRKLHYRNEAKSSFYNTKDLHTNNFFRPVSLIIPNASYDKF